MAMIERIGSCRILKEIGTGGMAVVYQGIQEPLGRKVAIKMLKVKEEQAYKRFEREAIFMASLQHENILHVHDFVRDHDTLWIIMEFIDGIDLFDLLDRTASLPPEVAAIIALQVARALDYAHFRGIIHRDIKPANVMISYQGDVKLMDFGIARDDSLTDLTDTGTGLGTPSYMSPEQILGDKLDARSDIFSLGIVLYQMSTGRKPFLEDDAKSVMQKIRLERHVSARKVNAVVPKTLDHIISRCLEKLPVNRYPTVQALIDDLSDFLAARVHVNHHARLVMFLRDNAFLGQEDADNILSLGMPRVGRKPPFDKRLLRDVMAVEGALLGLAALAAFLVQASNNEPSQVTAQTRESVWLPPADHADIRVTANPWAEVFIDGKSMGISPTAKHFAVQAGTHYVKAVNPFFEPVVKTVTVKATEHQHVVIELTEERHARR